MAGRAAGRAPARKRADSRAPQVLERAAECFARKGFEAASIRDIVRAVGMLPGSLYSHFENKDALLVAVYEEGVRRIMARVEAAIDGHTDPWVRLERACAAHIQALASRTAFAQVVVRVGPADVPAARSRLIGLRESCEGLYRGLIDALPVREGTDRRALRLMLLGALNWSPVWLRTSPGAATTFAAAFVGFLRDGTGRE